MAAQTHGAVDSLLGLLSSAIKDEARLLGGVHGDVQFIRDEMDSMNGFLLHLTKTEGEHDDQLRAWMKQVRDIAYIAEDCIELYVRDLAPPDNGFLAFLRHLPVYLWTAPARHRLATKIRELKVRVRDVGERRLRYGVNVPATEIKRVAKPPAGQDESAKAKEAFLQALEDDLVVVLPSGQLASEEAAGTSSTMYTRKLIMKTANYCPSFSKAIPLLPFHDSDRSEEADGRVRGILKKFYPCDDNNLSCTKMFLCALHLYPYASMIQELESLKHKLDDQVAEPKELVRTFCYSMLSTQQKSCLQYLTAFLEEKSISRTSLVRRWVAEGLVGKEQDRTPEEVGERCFELPRARTLCLSCRLTWNDSLRSEGLFYGHGHGHSDRMGIVGGTSAIFAAATPALALQVQDQMTRFLWRPERAQIKLQNSDIPWTSWCTSSNHSPKYIG